MKKKSIFKEVGHINVRVADLEEAVKFYTEVLGFTYIGKCDMRPVGSAVAAYVRRGSVTIELAHGHDMSAYTPNGIVNHIGLMVDDIQEAYAWLKERNVKILNEPERVKDDFYYFFFQGLSGERFEAMQYISGEPFTID